MQRLIYFLLFPLIFLFSRLPLRILYLISDFIFFILYNVTGYRRKVVMQNLQNAFPEKTESELKSIEKAYYRHLGDVMVETFKLMSFTKEQITRHCNFTTEATKLFKELYASNQNILIIMGHNGNWEICGLSWGIIFDHDLKVVYRPIKDQNFDRLIYKIRSRFGAEPVSMNNVMREFFKKHSNPMAMAFIADQAAPPESGVWVNFLNQEASFFSGYEKIARKFNIPLVFASARKISRGKYLVDAEILSGSPSSLPEGKATALFAQKLEDQIKNNPEHWLWSHRRWKHKKPEGILIAKGIQ